MKQAITYDMPDVPKNRSRLVILGGRIFLVLIIATVPLHAAFDCYVAKNKAKNSFWKECAARWLFLAITARHN